MTSDLGFWIPQIVNKYGRQEVNFDIKVLPNSMLEIGDGNIFGAFNTAMNISVGPDIIV